jgi:hypothetical protein
MITVQGGYARTSRGFFGRRRPITPLSNTAYTPYLPQGSQQVAAGSTPVVDRTHEDEPRCADQYRATSDRGNTLPDIRNKP